MFLLLLTFLSLKLLTTLMILSYSSRAAALRTAWYTPQPRTVQTHAEVPSSRASNSNPNPGTVLYCTSCTNCQFEKRRNARGPEHGKTNPEWAQGRGGAVREGEARGGETTAGIERAPPPRAHVPARVLGRRRAAAGPAEEQD